MIGCLDFRLSGDDWFITPVEFGALGQRFNEKRNEELYGSAMICSMLANIHRDTKKRPEPFQPSDFLMNTAIETRAELIHRRSVQWQQAHAHFKARQEKKKKKN